MNRARQILIIDDEPNLRLMFRTTLESAGYRVAEAASAAQGLEQLRRSPADLVLLDLQMPGLGGMEMLKQLRKARDPVPVVIITADGNIPDAVSAMRLGAIDFLRKPVTPEVLRTVAAQVFERHAGERPGSISARSRDASGADPFGDSLRRAKRALNLREFEEAETFLKKAIALDARSSEVQSLWGTLQKSRERQEEGPYHILRDLCG
jgi:DNA-binding NtrC family response regulator